MSVVVDTVFTTAFSFYDNAGDLVIGKVDSDFTKTAYLVSAGEVTATVTVDDVPGQDGDYSASFIPTAIGRWKIKVSCLHTDGVTYRWEEDVDAVQSSAASPASPTSGANTLSALREAVARKCEDWVEIEATSDGAVNTITSADAGVESNHYYRGTDILVVSSHVSNVGLRRRVADSDADNFTLTLAQDLPQPTMEGDIFHAFNVGGMGNRIRDYDARINDSIRGLGAGGRVFASVELDDPWDEYNPIADIPEEFTHVAGVTYTDSDGILFTVPGASSIDMDWGDGLVVDTVTKTIRLLGSMSRNAHGRTITLRGAVAHPPLVNDTDTTDINQDWLVLNTAASILIAKDSQIKKNTGGAYKNEADSIRAIASMPTPEGFIRVR